MFFNELNEFKLTLTELCLSKPYTSKNVGTSAFLVLTSAFLVLTVRTF